MRSFALASGSSGNAWYVESSEGYGVLVDCGLSYSKSKEILHSRGVDISELKAVLITHEHSDHVAGLKTFMKNLDTRYFMTAGTAKALDIMNVNILKHHSAFNIEDLKIFVLDKPHDAKEAVGFVFESNGKKLGIFTDLGHVNDEIKHVLKTLDIVYFEANYCNNCISRNSKDFSSHYLSRLMSDVGHLGLAQSIDAICQTAHDAQKIILSHISENTNYYENAYLQVKEALENAGKFPELLVSFQGEPSDWIE